MGEILREWRSRRRRRQLDLALHVGVSTRHLSFIETGRSRPSPAMLGALSSARVDTLAEMPLLVPCMLRLSQGRLSMFMTLTTFGTPRDVTLDELCIELFYPADVSTEVLLRSILGGAGDP